MAFTTVTLTGSYADRTNGDPARGYVTFQLSNALINDTVIAPRVKEKVHLADGAFSINLVATNDTGTTPTGATYEVVEHIDGASENTYSIELVYTDTTQDLADIAPTDAGNAIYGVSADTFAAHLSDTTDAHDASAISVTPDGNLSSVNAQDALEELDTEITAHDVRLGDQLDLVWVRKTANELVTNSEVLQNDDELFFTVNPGEQWEVEAWLEMIGPTAAGINLEWFSDPFADGLNFPHCIVNDWADAATPQLSRLQNLAGPYELPTVTSTSTPYVLKGHINGTQVIPTTVRLRWAQATANADFTSITFDSFIKLTRVTEVM